MICASQKVKDAEIANQSPSPCNKSRKVNDAEPILSLVIIFTSKGQKFENAKFRTKNAMKKTCISRIIKLFAKVKDAKKVPSNLQKTFFLKQSLKIKNFIL